MEVKNNLQSTHPYYYAKTETAWRKANRIVNTDAVGMKMYCNGYRQQIYTYYVFTETHEAYGEELKVLMNERRERQKRYNQRRQRRIEQKIRETEAEAWKAEIDSEKRKCINTVKNILEFIAAQNTYLPINIPSKAIVLDLETTGLSADHDEILQVSIIDLDGNILMDSYVRPYFKEEWKDAEAVNGISPESLNAPYLHEIIGKIQSIINGADLIIGYNINFDLKFLEYKGIKFTDKIFYDVMQAFAPIYGEWDEYHENYKWKNLRVCAEYFGYEFKPHNALEDVQATLYCYKKIQELSELEKSN